ncbi:MAG: helix-turn-helix domain-containing protein [Ignavibacteriaceae bacterium]
MENIIVTVLLLGALQGILLSVVLFTKKDNHTANIILGLAILAMSMDLLQAVYYNTGIYNEYPHLMGLTHSFPFLFGPIFYLYTKEISTGNPGITKKDLLHFIPFAAVFLYTIPVLILSAPEKIQFLHRMMYNNPPLDYAVISNIIPFHGIVYTVLTVRVISNHNRNIKESFSNIDKINLNWLRIIMIAMIIIWSLVAVGFFVPVNNQYDFVVPLAISILIYSIGYFGLKQPEIFQKYMAGETKKRNDDTQKELKYKKSGLKDEEAVKILNSLTELMEKEKLYLDSELTIQKLSEVINVSQHNLSEVINTKLNQNFYDLINRYRVEEVKRKIKNPDYSNLNFLGIAFESGFNSKTSFNTIFKKFTGLTPTQYKESISSEVTQKL